MVLNLSVKDIELSHNSTIYDNNIEISEKDIVSNLKLMRFLDTKKIYFVDKLKLNSLQLHFQNEIGTLFLEAAGFTINYNNKIYLNYSECRKLFAELDIVLSYLNIAYKKTQQTSDNPNVCDIDHFTTKSYNILILNYFALKYRNYASYIKNIDETDILYDINLDYGEYEKETSLTRFMLTHFLRFISTKSDQIPFSNGFGSNIKNKIQTKSNSFTKNIIYDEINMFLKELSSLYNKAFTIQNIELNESGYIAQKLVVSVYLKAAQEETVKIILEA